MRNFIVSISAAALALSAAPALAEGFNGPSVGVQAGWQEQKVRNPRTDAGTPTIDASRDAATGGIFAGYDRQVGPNMVLGVEAGFSIASSDRIRGGTAANPVQIDPKYSFDLTARAGYLVTPETLVYLRGGYADERVRTSITRASATISAAENRDGWVVGGGVERLIADHVSARLEYRYNDFGSGHGTFDQHQVLAGIAYRF